jgi:hypothetical protein
VLAELKPLTPTNREPKPIMMGEEEGEEEGE